MDWVTTSTILENLRDFQNGSAWDRFVSRFHKPILSFIRELGFSETDAEDVAQEALLDFAAAYRDGRYDRSKGASFQTFESRPDGSARSTPHGERPHHDVRGDRRRLKRHCS